MVVISTAICTRVRPLLARQFVQIPKQKLEVLLNSFCKLVEHSGTDHTYIQTDSVRYVYQPLDGIYLLLVTTKHSNIFEDLTTLRLFASVVQNLCVDRNSGASLESNILAKAFDLVFRIDEMISQGTREAVSLQCINTYAAMDSHEENIQNMITESKEKEQREKRREIANRLDKERLQGKREQANIMPVTTSLVNTSNFPADGQFNNAASDSMPANAAPHTNNAPTYKAMKLGAKRHLPAAVPTATQHQESPEVHDHQRYEYSESTRNTDMYSNKPVAVANPELVPFQGHTEPIVVAIQEKVKAGLQAEGGVTSVDVQGTFTLFINAEEGDDTGFVEFQLTPESKRFRLKAHPVVERNALPAESILKSRDPERPFPVKQPTPLLKWRAQEQSEDLVPVTFSCWPSAIHGGCMYTVEVEAVDTAVPIQDMHVVFTCPSQVNPRVIRVEGGRVDFDESFMHWNIADLSDTCGVATLEFQAEMEAQSLFPFNAEFNLCNTINDINILRCYSAHDKQTVIPYKILRSSQYSLTIS